MSDVLHMHGVSSCDKCRVTINMLPDDVLLHIFHSIRVSCLQRLKGVDRQHLPWMWHRLVHVCRRWRSLVFASANFLDLRLLCGPRTHVELTGIWPPLPIIIRNIFNLPMPEDFDFDAAIVQPHRVCEINFLYLKNSQLQRLTSAMHEQFPALIHLTLGSAAGYDSSPAPSLPDGFLGGSIPRLQSLTLHYIAFPALPKLLLSATDLVHLTFSNIPHSGYVSPEAFVTGLTVLTNLKSLTIGFKSPLSLPDWESRRPSPPTRTVLPALTYFEFHGFSEYLDDLVARIDAPLLDSALITFTHHLILDVPQLARFIRHRTWLQELNEAHVDFDPHSVQVKVSSPTRTFHRMFRLRITCKKSEWQLSSVGQVLTSFFPSVYMVEHLYIHCFRYWQLRRQSSIESLRWLEIFHPFIAVKNLYVSKDGAERIAPALQALARESVPEVLLTLESLYLEELPPLGPIQEAIGQFVAARLLLGHPVAVSHWNP